MQSYSLHAALAPSISLTRVVLDGTHNGAFQTGLGYNSLKGTGDAFSFLNIIFHDARPPGDGPAPGQAPYLVGVGLIGQLDQTNYTSLNGWDDPNVLFARGRFSWSTIEPTEGNFNWTPIDNFVLMCGIKGKKFSFNAGAGELTPQWVYDAGAYKYQFHDPNENPAGYEPLPWDQIYQRKYFKFLDAVAAHYKKDPNFILFWGQGFMSGGDMTLGSAGDEANMPHYGYPDIYSAYEDAAKTILRYIMSIFTTQNVLINFVRPFPSNTAATSANVVKDFLINNYPWRGGTGVSAIFAVQGFGSPAKATQGWHGFPHGGQEVQPTVLGTGAVNPGCYQTPPSPLPAHPQAFLDMGGNARALGNTFLETYNNDLGLPAIQAVLASENALYASIVPKPEFLKVSMGPRNGVFQIGFGYWRLYGTIPADARVIGKFLGSTIPFTSYFLRKFNSTFIIPLTSVLGTISRTFNQIGKKLIPYSVLNPRSDFFADPSTIQTIIASFASLISFSGSQSIRDRPLIQSMLSFIGSLQRPRVKSFTALLNFIGSFSKRARKLVAGAVSFIVSFTNGGILLASSLAFSGSVTSLKGKFFSAVLSFTGSIKALPRKIFTSSVSFVGRIFHSIPTFVQSLAGTLSFSGLFTVGRKFLQSVTAILSFVGSIPLQIKKRSIAVLSFTGMFNKIAKKLFAAALSFIGFFQHIIGIINHLALSAILSFSGLFSGIRSRIFVASILFIGNLSKLISNLKIGILDFVGTFKKAVPRIFQAMLSFSGFFQAVRPILKQFLATLAFAGFLSPIRGRIFIAILSFSGRINRDISKYLTAFISFSGNFIRAWPKLVTAALNFIGSIAFHFGKWIVFTANLNFFGLFSRFFHKLLLAKLSFRTQLFRLYGILQSIFLVNFNRDEQQVVSYSIERSKAAAIATTQSIDTTPTAINLAGLETRPLSALFVKNTDLVNSVHIDSSPLFDKFPQIIPPGLAIYLTTFEAGNVYAKSDAGAATIEVIAAP